MATTGRYSASIQHELRPRVSASFMYFRRQFGNYTHTDALLNQTDLRFARIFNYGRYRLQGMIDIYNIFNRSTVLAYNTTFGQEWLRPTDVLQGRLVKIGAQLTF